MIILSNSVAQTLAPGQSATFDTVVMQTGEAECFRINSGAIKLRFKNAIYQISAGANIGATNAGLAQLALAVDGSPLLETTMISQTAAADNLNNVKTQTAIKTCCCGCASITLINTGTTDVVIGVNPNIYIRRVA